MSTANEKTKSEDGCRARSEDPLRRGGREERRKRRKRRISLLLLSSLYLSGRDECSCADYGIPSSTWRQDKTRKNISGRKFIFYFPFMEAKSFVDEDF